MLALFQMTWFGWISFEGHRVALYFSTPSQSDDIIELDDEVVHVTCTHLHVGILLKNGRVGVRRIDDLDGKVEMLNMEEAGVENRILVSTSRQMFVVLVHKGRSEVLRILDDAVGIENLKDKLKHRIAFPWPVKIEQAAAGHDFLIYRDSTGNLFSMGTGTRGELGVGLVRHLDEPVHIEQLAGIRISKVVCGGWHTVALTAAGDVYTWGWNRNGQLGKDKMITEVYPILIDPLEEFNCPEENVDDIEATENSSTIIVKSTDSKNEITKYMLGSDTVPINGFHLIL
uniref:RCC1 domain-containing protein 1 n=2 Tax=Caenorhabditis japonica TaxID=281687 RepID=A0A8R1DXP3_CAEJA